MHITVKQFIDNYKLSHLNVLQVIHMQSYARIELSLFSSDHTIWCDTITNAYCHCEDITKQLFLQWSDISITNAIQFWSLVSAGYSAFFDLEYGQ